MSISFKKINNIIGYMRLLAGNLSFIDLFCSKNMEQKGINKLLLGYPSNHRYRIHRNRLIPGFELYERSGTIIDIYPEEIESFLDIGCCRGFYVLEAAKRPWCLTAAGIDIYKPFIDTAEMARGYLGVNNARFYFATLSDVAENPKKYGGPFQIILILGTYHYLFWGSKLCEKAYYAHKEILYMLHKICTHKVILSARLEISDLPRDIRERAMLDSRRDIYNKKDFIKTAELYFNIKTEGALGKYPLFIMSKKNLGEAQKQRYTEYTSK